MSNDWRDNQECAKCRKRDYLIPLHGENGGPFVCLLCKGAWHAEHGRRRRLGRIVIRALAAYFDGGGNPKDIEKLKQTAFTHSTGLVGQLSAMASRLTNGYDPLGYFRDIANSTGEPVELTSELLDNAIKIAHPDCHPPERQELAHRVTQGLLALKPFVFPALKPQVLKPLTAEPPSSEMDPSRLKQGQCNDSPTSALERTIWCRYPSRPSPL
jgi:hypothetical protein